MAIVIAQLYAPQDDAEATWRKLLALAQSGTNDMFTGVVEGVVHWTGSTGAKKLTWTSFRSRWKHEQEKRASH